MASFGMSVFDKDRMLLVDGVVDYLFDSEGDAEGEIRAALEDEELRAAMERILQSPWRSPEVLVALRRRARALQSASWGRQDVP